MRSTAFIPFDLTSYVVRTSGQQNSHRTTSTRLKRPIIMIEMRLKLLKIHLDVTLLFKIRGCVILEIGCGGEGNLRDLSTQHFVHCII